ncbi:MAG: YaiO family outer membrane beta-barrel protein [Pedobacter sp.]|nr:MAG: YaiO family outer membrane beta-barrel protein [Pedobacter sp.]
MRKHWQIMNKGNYNKYNMRLLIIGLCFIFGLNSLTYAQKVSSDDLLKQAMEQTNLNKDYDKAIQLAKQGLTVSPDYTDIQLLLGRLYLIKKEYTQGEMMLKKVLEKDPENVDALNYLINGFYAQKKYSDAIRYADVYLTHYPNDEQMQLKKVDFTTLQGDLKSAYDLSDSLSKRYPQNDKIRLINNDLMLLTRQNRVGVGYSVTAFDQNGRRPWDIYNVSYMRSEKNGSIIGRASYADRKTAKGYQFEVEAYPIHGNSYSFINMSYSNSIVFPTFRFSYSYFFPQKNGWEPEAGIRYLNNEEDFVSFVAALGKYFGKYWLSGKVFVTPHDDKVATSFALSGRYYIGESVDDYVTAIAGYGFSPDDRGRNFDIGNRINIQNARVTLGYQRTLWRRNILGLFGSWNNFKYNADNRRNEYDLAISFQHMF